MTKEPSLWEKYMKNPLTADPGMNGYCGVNKCDGIPWRDSPLCKPHAWDMWVQLNGELVDFAEEADEASWRHTQRDDEVSDIVHESSLPFRAKKPRDTAPGVIYYLQVGEHIKIGFSINLEARLLSYPPSSKLLAKHPGTIQTERHILGMFQDDLDLGREWFRQSPELLRHVEEVITKYHA